MSNRCTTERSPHPKPVPRLKVGEIVRHADRLWRVELVNECRARIVPLGRRAVAYVAHDAAGEEKTVAFEATERALSIGPYSELERVDPSMLTEEAMGKKKKQTTESRPKTEKGPKAGRVFAIRVTDEELAAIHKAAGPRNATRFIRAAAAAFASEDEAAFRTIVKEAREGRG